jgi:osmotically-inducible protein OsmY
MAPLLEPYSIQTLNNIRITVNRGFVILRGQVPSYEDKRNIQLE